MNTSIKRIRASLGANVTSQALTIFIQLTSIPLFLSVWTPELYGYWLMLSALPAYIALADFGFLSVIINKMTMLVASNEYKRAEFLFRIAIKLCIIICTVTLIISMVLISIVDVGILSEYENKLTLFFLIAYAVIAMSSRLVDAVFRSEGDFAKGLQLLNGIRLFEWLLLFSFLFYGKTFLWAAVGQLLGRVLGFSKAVIYARYKYPKLKWTLVRGWGGEFRQLVRPAISFMSFPVANALSFQGMTLLVGIVFSPAFLTVFNTYRTLSRVVVQASNVVSKSIGPEISKKFGERDFHTLNLIQSKGRLATMALVFLACGFLALGGEFFLGIWLKNKIEFNPVVFYSFLVVAFLNAVWQMEMVFLTSLNLHSGLSFVYLMASIIMLLLAYFVGSTWGWGGPVFILIGFEVVVGIWCVKSVRSYTRSPSLMELNV